MSYDDDPFNLDLVWGAKAIGAALNIGERKAFHLLATNQLPRVGKQWVATRENLRRFFDGSAPSARAIAERSADDRN
jgi:hypothetical protein